MQQLASNKAEERPSHLEAPFTMPGQILSRSLWFELGIIAGQTQLAEIKTQKTLDQLTLMQDKG